MKLIRHLGLAALLLLGLGLAIPAAYAAGIYEGYPANDGTIEGDEDFAVDTNLSGGRAPQTESVTMDQVKTFVDDVTDGQTADGKSLHTCGQPPMVSTDGTNSTPVITEFYYSEIVVPFNVTVTGVAVFNGSDVTGNVKVGLADSTGAIIATSASTAGSGTDAYQRIPFTVTEALTPGIYYVLTFYDSGTARYNTHTLNNCTTGKETGEVYATGFTAFTPATTFTTAIGSMASLY